MKSFPEVSNMASSVLARVLLFFHITSVLQYRDGLTQMQYLLRHVDSALSEVSLSESTFVITIFGQTRRGYELGTNFHKRLFWGLVTSAGNPVMAQLVHNQMQ